MKVVIQPDIFTDALPHIAEHKYSAIGKHLLDAHGDKNLINEDQLRFLKKCHGKFDYLVYNMLFNRWGLALTLKVITFVLNSLFSL